jgi:hypothetical protein
MEPEALQGTQLEREAERSKVIELTKEVQTLAIRVLQVSLHMN